MFYLIENKQISTVYNLPTSFLLNLHLWLCERTICMVWGYYCKQR